MKIHTVGDSHSTHGWSKIPEVYTHHIGPKLCYSIGRDKPNLLDGSIEVDVVRKQILNGDLVIFCLGEIDCRGHVHKHVSANKTYQVIIDEIVQNYFEVLNSYRQLMPELKISIYSIPPPCKQSFQLSSNHAFPFHGTDNERKQYYEYFYHTTKKKCPQYNFIFFDVYDKYKDQEGFLKRNLSDGGVHIIDPVFINEELERVKLLFN